MRIRRKTTRCLNCDRTLGEIYNYCPNCGQENNDHRVSFGTFIGDFFSNYFSFDSRIGRSLRPLFLQPGFLTNRFNEGKRKQYVHPLRLYLVASLVFFSLLALSVRYGIDDVRAGYEDSRSTDSDSTELSAAEKVIANESLTDRQVLDSLRKTGNLEAPDNWFGERIMGGVRKVKNQGPSWLLTPFINNMPVALLLALPILALMLKLAYYRKKIYYVNHLVHTLHLHSVALLLFSVWVITELVLVLFTDTAPNGNTSFGDYWLDELAAIVLLIYTFFSFLSVYQQRWWITLLKLTVISIVYIVVLSVAVTITGLLVFLNF